MFINTYTFGQKMIHDTNPVIYFNDSIIISSMTVSEKKSREHDREHDKDQNHGPFPMSLECNWSLICSSRAGWLVARWRFGVGFDAPLWLALVEGPSSGCIATGSACLQLILRDAVDPSMKPQTAISVLYGERPSASTIPAHFTSCSAHVSSFRMQLCWGLTCPVHPLARSIMLQSDADEDTSPLQWSPTAKGAQWDGNKPSKQLQLTLA